MDLDLDFNRPQQRILYWVYYSLEPAATSDTLNIQQCEMCNFKLQFQSPCYTLKKVININHFFCRETLVDRQNILKTVNRGIVQMMTLLIEVMFEIIFKDCHHVVVWDWAEEDFLMACLEVVL